MTDDQLITKITEAQWPEELFSFDSVDKEYKDYAKRLHPDVTDHPGANDAFAKMTQLRDSRKAQRGVDEGGAFEVRGDILLYPNFETKKDLFWKSLDNYLVLKNKIKRPNYLLNNYGQSVKEKKSFCGVSTERMAYIEGRTFSEEHVRWMLSRMLELSAYIFDAGYVHGGINPDSVMFQPALHGIQLTSYYHMTKIKLSFATVSGKYHHWYPSSLFKTKIPGEDLDSYLSKKTAICLLGDPSGSGMKLKRTVDSYLINFLLKEHKNSVEAFLDYKKNVLSKYEAKFHSLNI